MPRTARAGLRDACWLRVLAFLIAVALFSVLSPAHVQAAEPHSASSPTARNGRGVPTAADHGLAPRQVVLPTADELLAQLVIAPEGPREGYDRDKRFKHWIDADRDGCNTRAEVLIDESQVETVVAAPCKVVAGEWFSYYDARVIQTATGVDIDHMVPLAEAWDSGAAAWDDTQRQAYANDLDHPEALVAVSASSNRSKSDQDPAEWTPPSRDAWCQYGIEWTSVKVAWHLTADQAEVGALRSLLASCAE